MRKRKNPRPEPVEVVVIDRTSIGELYDVLHKCENDHEFRLSMYEWHWEKKPREHYYDYTAMGTQSCPHCGSQTFEQLEQPSRENSRNTKERTEAAHWQVELAKYAEAERKDKRRRFMLRITACL